SALEQARRQEIDALFDLYEKRLPFIQGEGLVPTHGDPNPGNVLVAPETTYLVDWDRLHLSDPMHDIAQVLWWTYPRPAWSEALELFQIDLSDDQQRERFYLYLSVWALEVSLFFSGIQNEYFARRFLTDARRAYEQEPPVEHLVS
ncbi:MAG: aminoglycoside phosphotransferase family protein, partial [Ktedonobacteraceae bacterium]|nr:aminoglycoside phosphotransferase family protein [Ktedonobacteraceae bacterium]